MDRRVLLFIMFRKSYYNVLKYEHKVLFCGLFNGTVQSINLFFKWNDAFGAINTIFNLLNLLLSYSKTIILKMLKKVFG